MDRLNFRQNNYVPQLSLLALLILFSLLLMGADCKLGAFRIIRSDLEPYCHPLHKTVSAPLQFAFSSANDIEFFFKKQSDLKAQIQSLKQKNTLLLAENQKKKALENENVQLKVLLNVSKMRKEKLQVASLLHVSADPFSQYIVLDKGKTEGVSENQAILDTQGILGLVNSVNKLSSKVRLITDKAHAVPVQNSRNGLRGIASGTGKPDALVLLHTPLSADYQVGDELLTSGLGGRFPAGYPVGIVSKVEHPSGQAFARITVKPLADFSKIDHVLIVTQKLVDIDSTLLNTLSIEAAKPVSVPTESATLELIPAERLPMSAKPEVISSVEPTKLEAEPVKQVKRRIKKRVDTQQREAFRATPLEWIPREMDNNVFNE